MLMFAARVVRSGYRFASGQGTHAHYLFGTTQEDRKKHCRV